MSNVKCQMKNVKYQMSIMLNLLSERIHGVYPVIFISGILILILIDIVDLIVFFFRCQFEGGSGLLSNYPTLPNLIEEGELPDQKLGFKGNIPLHHLLTFSATHTGQTDHYGASM